MLGLAVFNIGSISKKVKGKLIIILKGDGDVMKGNQVFEWLSNSQIYSLKAGSKYRQIVGIWVCVWVQVWCVMEDMDMEWLMDAWYIV